MDRVHSRLSQDFCQHLSVAVSLEGLGHSVRSGSNGQWVSAISARNIARM